MKMQKTYICEFCNCAHTDKNDALECEKFHVKPLEIVKERYLSKLTNKEGYPVAVTIKMSDGTKQVYSREFEFRR